VTEDADFEAGFVVNFDLALRPAHIRGGLMSATTARSGSSGLTPEEAVRRAQRERERFAAVTTPAAFT
jgi:hypothetical protein